MYRIFDDITQCKSCFRIASASAGLEFSSAIASATFRYAGFSLRKRNSRTSPLCNFIMEVFDAAHIEIYKHSFWLTKYYERFPIDFDRLPGMSIFDRHSRPQNVLAPGYLDKIFPSKNQQGEKNKLQNCWERLPHEVQ